MVLADSHGIPRAPCYSGINNLEEIFGYKTITFFGITFQLFHLISSFRLTFASPTKLTLFFSHNPFPFRRIEKFRLFPFRSPLLRESFLLSFPLGTKMFQFPRFALLLLIDSVISF